MLPASIYQQRIQHFQQTIFQEKRLGAALSWARLISFVVIITSTVMVSKNSYGVAWWLLLGIGLLAFLYLVIRYHQSQQKLQLYKTLLELNQKEWQQATGGQPAFEDGREFIEDKHDFSIDLDVFGPASIFQYINRTGTFSGKQQLAAALCHPVTERTTIVNTQIALQALAPALEFRQLLTAHGMLAKEEQDDRHEIDAWLEMPFSFLHNKWLRVAIWLNPVLVLAATMLYISSGHYYPLVSIISLNWLLLLCSQKKIMAQYTLISRKEHILDKFSILLHLIKDESFKQSILLQQQQEIAREAALALHRLSRISRAFDQRLNLLVALFFNSIMLYDLHCIFRLERWKWQHKQHVAKWLDVISQMEVWNSFATYAYNCPQYSWPVPQQDCMILEATALGHPLIPADECIKNNSIAGKPASFLIITGSNMSGKSTFLRSIGVNLLLAMCGAPVCADKFLFTPVRLMTSMRIKDSIAGHTSYFQAELLRLQQIVRQLKTGERVFILLDEILKGTNSEDKLSGSRSLIAHFLQYNCLGMIATHDLELGQLENVYPQQIKNYCFESTIQHDQLSFDYHIREGIARNKNATFLMHQMEII